MNYLLDLTAYRCPLPLLITKKALQQLEQGERLSQGEKLKGKQLVVRLNQFATLKDFEQLAQTQGRAVSVLSTADYVELTFSP